MTTLGKHWKMSEETKEKMRQAHLGKKRTPESIEKQRQATIGRKDSPETIEKKRLANIERYKDPKEREKTGNASRGKHWKMSDEGRANISKSCIGRKDSQETREKKRQKMLGHKNSLGFKHSPEYIKNLRKRMIGNNYSDGRGRGCYYNSKLQGKIWMRSSYELAYAKYLDSINEPYFYEPGAMEMIINEKDTTYRPDFSLPLKLEFIEIKGYMTQRAKLKCDKFKEELNNEELMGIFGYKILYYEDLKKLGIKI